MKTILAYIETAKNIAVTLQVDGEFRNLTVPSDHAKIEEAKVALEEGDAETLIDLLDTKTSIEIFSEGKVEIEGNTVSYNGYVLNNTLVARLIHLKDEGQRFEYLVSFLEKLMENPSKRAVDELYTFLEHHHLPITNEGEFLAYKAVKSDFTDKYTGTIDNSVGNVIEMPRNQVNDDKTVGCSEGYHAGTLEYAGHQYGNIDNGDKLLIVRIDPKDVVSVPLDCSCQKLRTCKYTVIGEYTTPLEKSVYTQEAEEIQPTVTVGWDDEYDEYDEYEDDEYEEDNWTNTTFSEVSGSTVQSTTEEAKSIDGDLIEYLNQRSTSPSLEVAAGYFGSSPEQIEDIVNQSDQLVIFGGRIVFL